MRNSVNNTGGVNFDQIFRAIGDPHRLQILTLLREKELSAGEILSALDVVQSTLSHHMKSLVDAGVVRASRHGKWTYYSLCEENIGKACLLLKDFSEGTKVHAQLPQRELGSPQAASGKERKPAKDKTAAPASSAKEADTAARGEKKKSKKGKKGKKNKK